MRSPAIALGSVVVVEWRDAGSAATVEEAGAIVRRSVGYLIRRDRRGVWLAMEQDALSDVHHIPRGMVLSVAKIY